MGDRECRVAVITTKAMEGAEILDCSPEGLPGVRARNVQMVAAGTGEALPGVASLGSV